jgi:hypothetical protein
MTQLFRASKLALAALCVAGGAFAAAPAPTRAPAVQAVVDCGKIADGPARLACYDKAVAEMQAAEARGDLVTIDREQRRSVRRQAFGFSLPSLSLFDRGEKPEEVDRVTDKVASVGHIGYGKLVIRLESGAVWRQIDDNELGRPPHAGSTAEVRKAALGSFMMKLDGQPAIRVHRDN